MRAKELLRGHFGVITWGLFLILNDSVDVERHWDGVRDYRGHHTKLLLSPYIWVRVLLALYLHGTWLVLS